MPETKVEGKLKDVELAILECLSDRSKYTEATLETALFCSGKSIDMLLLALEITGTYPTIGLYDAVSIVQKIKRA